jgi:quercetin dioxygenase-like cupin family protein
MEIVHPEASAARPIGPRPYEVERVSSIELAEGNGEAHAYVLHFEPGGVIGQHEAGFGQLFFALAGTGWVAGEDGVRRPLAEGEAAFISRGEAHSKGSDSGFTALMIQVRNLEVLLD